MQSSRAVGDALSDGHSIDEKSSDGKFTLAKILDSEHPTEFIANIVELAKLLPEDKCEACLELAMYFAGWSARTGLYHARISMDMGEEGRTYNVIEHPESKVKLPTELLRSKPTEYNDAQGYATVYDERQSKLGTYIMDLEGSVYPGYNVCRELNFADDTGEKLYMKFVELLGKAGARHIIRYGSEF